MQKIYIKIFTTIILLFSINIQAQELSNDTISCNELTLTLDSLLTQYPDSANIRYSDEEIAKINKILDALSTGVDIESNKKKKKEKKDKNFKFSILGGPGYSPDYGFSIGLATLMTFRAVKSDTSLQRSVIPLNFTMSFGKPLGFTLISKPYIYFKDDKIRLQGLYEYKHTGENYYGVGYTLNHNTERKKEKTGYNADLLQINPVLLFRIKKSASYIGPIADLYYEKIKNPGSFVIEDPLYKKQGGTAEGLTDINIGLGLAYSYDTRDIAANAYKGMLFEARALFYSKYFGGEYNFGSITIDYRQYYKVSKTHRRVLAWNILAKTKIGNVPFSQQAIVGGPFNLRGYYLGQYRDHTAVTAEVEWRHMWDIATDTKFKRLLHRLGYAAWVGCGFMGENIIKYNAVLPNIGGGLRVEVQKRMNFRVDAGYSFADKHALFYFNMTEAF